MQYLFKNSTTQQHCAAKTINTLTWLSCMGVMAYQIFSGEVTYSLTEMGTFMGVVQATYYFRSKDKKSDK